jgi:hypothetical protein
MINEKSEMQNAELWFGIPILSLVFLLQNDLKAILLPRRPPTTLL